MILQRHWPGINHKRYRIIQTYCIESVPKITHRLLKLFFGQQNIWIQRFTEDNEIDVFSYMSSHKDLYQQMPQKPNKAFEKNDCRFQEK